MLFGVDELSGVDVFLLSCIIFGLMVHAAVITAACVWAIPRFIHGLQGFYGAHMARLHTIQHEAAPVLVKHV